MCDATAMLFERVGILGKFTGRRLGRL